MDMINRKIPTLIFLTVIVAVTLVSVVFWVIVSGTSEETWKSIGYPSAFLLGLIGAASVIIPVPTTFALLGMSISKIFDPTLLAFAFGFGAAVGQLTSYAVGYAGGIITSKKHERRLNAMLTIFKRYGMIAVFIFSLTPLPDSLLFIPMGIVHYNIWKVFIAAVAGKILMSLIITHFGGVVERAFTENWIFALVTLTLLILVVIVMFKIDWGKFVKRYAPKETKKRVGR